MTREEAIDVVKKNWPDDRYTRLKEALETLIPELAESEDKRMMRVIGLSLTDVPEERFTSLGTTLKDCLAWIENQNHDGKKWITPAELNRLETLRYEAGFDAGVRSEKEKQKDASKAIEAVDRIDKYIDEHVVNAHDMKDSNPDKKYYRGWDDALGKMSGILQDVYSEEKQKKQKSIDYSEELKKCKDNPFYFYDNYVKVMQKPVECEAKE